MAEGPACGEPPTRRRGVIRLVVASPDRHRVLALPNGLAGWALPTLAVDLPFDAWDEATLGRAADLLGSAVTPGERVAPGVWSATPTGRLPAAGRTWIGVDEVDRLGADAAVVRSWASTVADVRDGPAHGGEPSG